MLLSFFETKVVGFLCRIDLRHIKNLFLNSDYFFKFVKLADNKDSPLCY